MRTWSRPAKRWGSSRQNEGRVVSSIHSGVPARAAEQVIEPRDALGVGPLGVLDADDDRRALAREPDDDLRHREPERVARGAGVGHLGQRLVREEVREHLDASLGLEHHLGDRRARDGDVRGARVLERGALGHARDLAREIRQRRRAGDSCRRSRTRRGARARPTSATRCAGAPRDEDASCRCPERPVSVTSTRRPIVERALERRDDLRELGLASHERRAAQARRACPTCGAADERGAVVADLELVAAAGELGGRRVEEHLPALRVAREGRGAVDDLADGARAALDARTARGDADRGVDLGEPQREIDGARGLVAQRAARRRGARRSRRRRARWPRRRARAGAR